MPWFTPTSLSLSAYLIARVDLFIRYQVTSTPVGELLPRRWFYLEIGESQVTGWNKSESADGRSVNWQMNYLARLAGLGETSSQLVTPQVSTKKSDSAS